MEKNKYWSNNYYVKKNIYFEIVRWETFAEPISKEGLQSEYNKAVKECDIFVGLFYTKVGKYTELEFDTAFQQLVETSNKPLIYTYFKVKPVPAERITYDILSLLKFRDKLRDLDHYPSKYENIQDLKYKFKTQIQEIVEF